VEGQARTSEKDEAEDESSSHEAPPPSRISTLPSSRCTRSCPSDSLPAHPGTLSVRCPLLQATYGSLCCTGHIHMNYMLLPA
jgi:hypothetical protein